MEWKDKTTQDLMDECFTNEDIKAVVSQLWVYYGAPITEQTSLIFAGRDRRAISPTVPGTSRVHHRPSPTPTPSV